MAARRPSFKNQDYNQIKNECLKSKTLFCDELFNLDVKNATWLRPKEIVKDPKFFVDGVSRFDVVQGASQDCWLVVAMANLTRNPNLFEHVVPKDQNFTDSYAGIFRFHIWQCGVWVEVVVDDRLPTKGGKLMLMHSRDKNEFWSALLEKAYAKLYGSYNELTVGWFSEAIVDFTGGVVERVNLSPAPQDLGTIISKSLEKSSFMCVFMTNDPSITEMITSEGLVKGHAYSINRAQTVSYRNGKILLLRLRNPWGKQEWKGAWSDSSHEWKSISSEERNKIGLVSDNDGEFWMSITDFSKRFEHIDICHLSPDVYSNFDGRIKVGWESNSFKGEWSKNVTAGGFYIETFHLNPQYRITLTDTDDDDRLCTVIIALMQRNKTRKVWHRIGFTTFYLTGPEKLSKQPLSKDYIKKNFKKSSSSKFRARRDNVLRDAWEPGVYCIVPSTYKPGEEGQYLLRVFSEKQATMEENEISDEVSEPVVGMLPEELNEPMQEKIYNQRKNETKLLKRTDQEIAEFFHKIAGKEGEIGWQGLQTVLEYALNNAQTPETSSTGFFSMVVSFVSSLFGPSEEKLFTKDECRNMIAMLDDDMSGRLSFREFQILLNKLRSWESAFLNYSNESDYVDATELNKALREVGYHVKTSDVSRLVRRYSDNDGKLAFDDFVMCAIDLIETGITQE